MTEVIDTNANADANENNGNEEQDLDLGEQGTGNGDQGGDDQGDDSKSNERVFSDEDKLAMHRRAAERLERKLGKNGDSKAKPSAKKGKDSDAPEGFDYGQKAFLIASGLKTKAEMDLAFEAVQNSGKELETVLESGWFKADLAALQTRAAMPKGQNRSGSQSGYDTVDYWIAKGGLPTDNPELARKVVNARIKAKNGGSPFSSQSVVGGR